MKQSRSFILPFLLLITVARAAETLPAPLDFNREIRPILSDKCFSCHGPDKKKRKGRLRLDLEESAKNPKKNAVVPGKPKESELIYRITTDDEEELMPPGDSGKSLTAKEKELLTRWIAEGAKWEDHWAYAPPMRPPLPDKGKDLSPIDQFILARLKEINLSPAHATDPRTLARRLHLDLIGLPPKPAVVATYVANPSPKAYAKLVDDLLASPHFGERLALPWLDLARYADSVGYQKDRLRECWLYRDYLIRAFNENKPYDRFVIEQLAGDLLEGDPLEQRSWLIASGFNRMNQTTSEGGAQA